MMAVVRGRGAGVIVGRAGAGEHRARRYDEVEEAQRRLRQREAQLRAPKAERSSEEAGQHLLLFVRCGSTFVGPAPIDACRSRLAGVLAAREWLLVQAPRFRRDQCAAAAAAMESRYSAHYALDV